MTVVRIYASRWLQVGFSSSCYTQVAGSCPAKFPEEVTKLQQAEESKDFSFSYNPRPRRALGSAARWWKEEKVEEVFWCSVKANLHTPAPRWGQGPFLAPLFYCRQRLPRPRWDGGRELGNRFCVGSSPSCSSSQGWAIWARGASYRFAKKPLGVATPHFLLNRQMTHTRHGCLVPEVPLLCHRWPTPALGLLVGSGLPTFGKLPEPLTSSWALSLLPSSALKFSDGEYNFYHTTAQRLVRFFRKKEWRRDQNKAPGSSPSLTHYTSC